MVRKFLFVLSLITFSVPAFATTLNCTNSERSDIRLMFSAKNWTNRSENITVFFKMFIGERLFVKDNQAEIFESPEVIQMKIVFPGNDAASTCKVVFAKNWTLAFMDCYENGQAQSLGSYNCTAQ